MKSEQEPGFGFTSKTWECIAITLEEYQEFMASIFRSRDPNEKQLRARIEEDVLPIIEKRAEAIRQKKLKKLRELENVQKMATAKRSGRLASKAEREAKEQEERDAEERKRQDLKMAHEEQERQKRIEEVSLVAVKPVGIA
jgi:prophage antirepressor-like protein